MRWILPVLLLSGCHLLIGHQPSSADLATADLLTPPDLTPELLRADLSPKSDDRGMVPDMNTCPPPLEPCGGECVDTKTDVKHCGSCGLTCETSDPCQSSACKGGVCVPVYIPCGPGQSCFGGQCCACISNNLCVPVPSPSQCGVNGEICKVCPAPTCKQAICDPNGSCVASPLLDGSPCLNGVCVAGSCCNLCVTKSGTCAASLSDGLCGMKGALCQDCKTSGQVCSDGQCVGP